MAESELQVGKVLYDENEHKVIWLGWGEDDDKGAVQTNQYLIVHRGKGVLLDPGGVHLFSRVVAVISNYINLDNIEAIFFSHQDPDVSSGIALWLGVTKANIHISNLWLRFVPHFGIMVGGALREIAAAGNEETQAIHMGLNALEETFDGLKDASAVIDGLKKSYGGLSDLLDREH